MSRRTTRPVLVVAATAVLALLGSSPAAAAPALAATGGTCPASDARAAADAYLAALTSHDASDVPLAPDVLRIENGLVTGSSAEEIRHDLETSWKYRIISRLHDRSYTDGDVAADGTTGIDVTYVLDVGATALTLVSVGVQEHFDVKCEQITYINAVIGLP